MSFLSIDSNYNMFSEKSPEAGAAEDKSALRGRRSLVLLDMMSPLVRLGLITLTAKQLLV